MGAALSASIGLLVALTATLTANGRDILRPNGGSNPGASLPSAAGSAGASSNVSAAGANALDALARNTAAVQAMQAMQNAARQAAASKISAFGQGAPGAVPNGLNPGGLQVATGAKGAPVQWTGANAPEQTSNSKGGVTVTVNQTQQTAVLDWSSFNIGAKTSLAFDQSLGGDASSKWIAINEVNNPLAVPSQILGSIYAQGQVFVVDRNGILFGGTSQVNTHIFIASSLPIDTGLVDQGLLNNPDGQFLFSALPEPAGASTPAFTPPALSNANPVGDVVVEAGATISAPTTADHVGGRVVLVGPNVTNNGTISTPDGQTILAAGLQVGFLAHVATDPSLRGLDTFVGPITAKGYSNPAGTATNGGYIDVPRGDISINGAVVNQSGVLESTTSVTENGRIDLSASYDAITNPTQDFQASNYITFLYTKTGALTLGADSVTAVLPEYTSTATITGTSLALSSQVNLYGKSIHLDSGASLLAPSAIVNFEAGEWNPIVSTGNTSAEPFSHTDGSILVASGASINVAGSADVTEPATANIVSAQLLGPELANSPLQRNGILNGQTIQIDIQETGVGADGLTWVGTPVADVSGYVNLIERTVGELTTAGGTVNLQAGLSVTLQPGSTINVSGGYIAYQGGIVQTTRLITGGQLVNISQASPDLVYSGIYTGTQTYTDSKWGATATFSASLPLSGAHYVQAYDQGGAGGAIEIVAPTIALQGDLVGLTIDGLNQRQPQSSIKASTFAAGASDPLYALVTEENSPPPSAALILTFEGEIPGNTQTGFLAIPSTPTSPKIVFENGSATSSGQGDQVVLSNALFTQDGFGQLSINNPGGSIVVPAGVSLTIGTGASSGLAADGGSINFLASSIDIEGAISAPAGSLSFQANNLSLATLNTGYRLAGISPPNLPSTPGYGGFILGAHASLSVAGLIVDDRPGSQPFGAPTLQTSGGSISILGYDVALSQGSNLDADGGAHFTVKGDLTYGSGGTISIAAGQEPTQAPDDGVSFAFKSVPGGNLVLGSSMQAYTGLGAGVLDGQTVHGGKLKILAPAIEVGDSASAGVLVLQPDFFNQGGFSSFVLEGLGAVGSYEKPVPVAGIAIDAGVTIAPQVQTVLYGPSSDNLIAAPTLLPAGSSPTVSLTFNAVGLANPIGDSAHPVTARGDLIMGEGAQILAGPGGSVTLEGQTATVLGAVYAPGGTITVTGASLYPFNESASAAASEFPRSTVFIGPQAVLSTAGVALYAQGYGNQFPLGTVLNGGEITLSGNIVAAPGSALNVSGASGTFDLAPGETQLNSPGLTSFAGAPVATTTVASNGGVINLQGAQELFSAASLTAQPGGPTALGGGLVVSTAGFFPANSQAGQVPLDPTLQVTQGVSTFMATGVGQVVKGANGAVANGLNAKTGHFFPGGHIAVDTFAAGGFDSVSLLGTVEFTGSVSIQTPGSLTVARELSPAAGAQVANGGVIFLDHGSIVTLSAPYVALGEAFQTPGADPAGLAGTTPNSFYQAPPTFGSGDLTVYAQLIDVGNLSMQGAGHVSLIANNGDIRGDGAFDVMGSIYLRAAQIYPATAVNFTITALDPSKTDLGSVTIVGSGVESLPYSAGGSLSIFASKITQDGTLRAPFGTIELGWDGTDLAPPKDPVSGLAEPVAQQVILGAGSVTSVSAIDPITGAALTLPYGVNPFGNQWFTPTGADITSVPPSKAITIGGVKVTEQAGATIDLRSGGDLLSYQFTAGTGGAYDVLLNPNSYAILPGYAAAFAPYAPFNATISAQSTASSVNPFPAGANPFGLTEDPGYYNAGLAVGEQIRLGASPGLPAGVYTLLPARYALLPGAFLVTPATGAPVAGTLAIADGSYDVAGYTVKGLNTQTSQSLAAEFNVAASGVLNQRSQYATFSADEFIAQQAAQSQLANPTLPSDAGHLILAAASSLSVEGTIQAGTVDIASANPNGFYIYGSAAQKSEAPAGAVTLSSTELTLIDAGSLLIGGYRETVAAGSTPVVVDASKLEVNNAGSPLSGSDIILVSNGKLQLDQGSEIEATGSTTAETLLFGSAGNGDGALLRVSADASAQIVRSGVTEATGPDLTLAAGVRLSGAGVIVDSTAQASIAPSVQLHATSLSLDSGTIDIVLPTGASTPPAGDLALSGVALADAESVHTLSLLSYGSADGYINILGSGMFGGAGLGELELHTPAIAGFTSGGATGGAVQLVAQNISLDNVEGLAAPAPATAIPSGGALTFDALHTITIGSGSAVASKPNVVALQQFQNVNFIAPNGLSLVGTGAVNADGNLNVSTSLVTGVASANQTLTALGDVAFAAVKTAATVAGGAGASLTVNGSSITEGTVIQMTSGTINLNATGAAGSGDVDVTGTLSVAGTYKQFLDLAEYLGGGQINLSSANGSVNLGANSTVTVAANPSGGDAGSLSVTAGNAFNIATGAHLLGAGGGLEGVTTLYQNGETIANVPVYYQNGTFSLNANTIVGANGAGDLGALNTALTTGGFTQSVSIRDRSDATVTIATTATAYNYAVSADQGNIVVAASGKIDASNANGPAVGSVDLAATGNITIDGTITVASKYFNAAGEGGSVTLEAGAETVGGSGSAAMGSGFVSINSGSNINLTVADNSAQSANYGDLAGTLLLRGPQVYTGGQVTGVQVNPIAGSITGAGSVVVEGYQIFDLTNVSNGGIASITNTGSIQADGGLLSAGVNVEGSVAQNGKNFVAAVSASSFTSDAGLLAIMHVRPGAEVINTAGDLDLTNNWDFAVGATYKGSGDPSLQSNWNLGNMTYRFGPNLEPGYLTLRASGNIVIGGGTAKGSSGSLSDGFSSSSPVEPSNVIADTLWDARMLPSGVQSWSFRVVAGADFTAAAFNQVLAYNPNNPTDFSAAYPGELPAGSILVGTPKAAVALSGTTNSALENNNHPLYQVIRTGTGNIQLASQGDVDLLNPFATIYTAGEQVASPQNVNGTNNFDLPNPDAALNGNVGGNPGVQYPVYYTFGGGNVSIAAQGNIQHLNGNPNGDSDLELPTNWLYRRGDVNSLGAFATNADPNYSNEIASTTWWVDFSNFFEGVGALGGGNVTLNAGQNIYNVDAVIPTNARVAGVSSTGGALLASAAGSALELGGGDLVVRAGADIEAGAYYVERGLGRLVAGGSVTPATNGDYRSSDLSGGTDPLSYLPTTLFVGESSFVIQATGSILLGPIANPFLLPQGVENGFYYKTYFSTYAPDSTVQISSASADVTFRVQSSEGPLLDAWYANEVFGSAGLNLQPWLATAEANVTDFVTASSIMPPNLQVTTFTGSIDIAGSINLFPSSTGKFDLLSAKGINGIEATEAPIFLSAIIDVSDANPSSLPSVASPLGYASEAPAGSNLAASTGFFLSVFDNAFAETGVTQGADKPDIQVQEALHDSALLHANDPYPVHLYAVGGNISGVELYTPKAARIVAGVDISDVSFFLQNVAASDISVVSAGRDIISYDPTSALRAQLGASANAVLPETGDIQISGPGTLEVLAGRNLTLGSPLPGATDDGLGVGISSVGNARNPYLPFGGADVVAAAGVGLAAGLDQSALTFSTFITDFVTGAAGARYLAEFGDVSSSNGGATGATLSASDFKKLPAAEQDLLALDIFFLVLRDAGRDHNTPTSADFGTYAAGLKAIADLFPTAGTGDIDLSSRNILTTSGGNISVLAPGGRLSLGELAETPPPGIVTQDGGNVSIFTQGDVNVGVERIFTLRGGNEIIWSSTGNIAAGFSAKTVQSAPPTRVLIDPQSGDVATDLGGLATGGGIGVLASVIGVPPGNVDLIAPTGSVNAGDAGIRATGNLNIAAVHVLNAGNIQVGGAASGVPAAAPASAPPIGGLSAGSSQAGAASQAADQAAQATHAQEAPEEPVSIITVEVIGYGGGEGTDTGDSSSG